MRRRWIPALLVVSAALAFGAGFGLAKKSSRKTWAIPEDATPVIEERYKVPASWGRVVAFQPRQTGVGGAMMDVLFEDDEGTLRYFRTTPYAEFFAVIERTSPSELPSKAANPHLE